MPITTTASTNTTIAHTNSTTFRAWATEIDTALVTTLTLTNTADTGQTATSALVYSASTNTQAGYRIYSFNDTLQATSPIFIKLEFGTGGVATSPQLVITIASSTNGAGTMTGQVSTRVAAFQGAAPASTVVNYVSRFCYNPTQGVLQMTFKISSTTITNQAAGGFSVHRSVDGTGAPTATSAMLMSNGNSAVASGSGPAFGAINYSLSTTLASLTSGTTAIPWVWLPLGATGTLEGTNGQVFPAVQWAPTASVPPYGITNALAMGITTEIALGATVTVTILGSTSLTYIAVGTMFGCNNNAGFSLNNYQALMLWT